MLHIFHFLELEKYYSVSYNLKLFKVSYVLCDDKDCVGANCIFLM